MQCKGPELWKVNDTDSSIATAVTSEYVPGYQASRIAPAAQRGIRFANCGRCPIPAHPPNKATVNVEPPKCAGDPDSLCVVRKVRCSASCGIFGDNGTQEKEAQ